MSFLLCLSCLAVCCLGLLFFPGRCVRGCLCASFCALFGFWFSCFWFFASAPVVCVAVVLPCGFVCLVLVVFSFSLLVCFFLVLFSSSFSSSVFFSLSPCLYAPCFFCSSVSRLCFELVPLAVICYVPRFFFSLPVLGRVFLSFCFIGLFSFIVVGFSFHHFFVLFTVLCWPACI